MPISAEALLALREASKWNPTGSRALLAALQEHPDWVKYKRDEFGPLHLILEAVPPRTQVTPTLEIPHRPAPFPDSLLPACRQFGEEWRAKRFSKPELAQQLERILQDNGLQ
jgi:hypothetical protein